MQLSHAFHGLALCIVYQLGLGLHNFSACASSLLLALLLLLFLLLFVIIIITTITIIIKTSPHAPPSKALDPRGSWRLEETGGKVGQERQVKPSLTQLFRFDAEVFFGLRLWPADVRMYVFFVACSC